MVSAVRARAGPWRLGNESRVVELLGGPLSWKSPPLVGLCIVGSPVRARPTCRTISWCPIHTFMLNPAPGVDQIVSGWGYFARRTVRAPRRAPRALDHPFFVAGWVGQCISTDSERPCGFWRVPNRSSILPVPKKRGPARFPLRVPPVFSSCRIRVDRQSRVDSNRDSYFGQWD